MLATLTEDRFSDPKWLFERKWDGVRCLAFRTAAGRVRLRTRNDQPLERTYPEIAEAIAAQCDVAAVLDGEVVAFDGRRTSFERLQGRMGLSDPDAARATGIAVYYYVFDVLHLDGHDVRGLPLRDRKRLLRDAVALRRSAALHDAPQHRWRGGVPQGMRARRRGSHRQTGRFALP